jgi:hypothetical protein
VYQLAGTSSGKRDSEPFALSTMACKWLSAQNAHAGYCRSVGAHLKLEQLGLRHKAHRNASASEATRATDAVKIRGVVAGQVHVDDQVDIRKVKASSVQVCRNQDPQPKCARLCKRGLRTQLTGAHAQRGAYRLDDFHPPPLEQRT